MENIWSTPHKIDQNFFKENLPFAQQLCLNIIYTSIHLSFRHSSAGLFRARSGSTTHFMWHCWANHTYRKPNVLCKLQLLLPIPYTGFTFTPHGWTEWLGRNRRKAFADVEGRTKHRFTFKCTYTEKKKNFFFLQSGIVSWRLISTNFFQVLLDIREKVNLDFFFLLWPHWQNFPLPSVSVAPAYWHVSLVQEGRDSQKNIT